MEGLFSGYTDPNPETGRTTGGGADKVYKKKMKKKKMKKQVTSEDVPGEGMAKDAAKAIERRRAVLDAM